jgi:hypothetical protein
MRAMMSVMPPAAAVTTSFTAREGNADGLFCGVAAIAVGNAAGNVAGNAQSKPRKIISRCNMDMASPRYACMMEICHKKLIKASLVRDQRSVYPALHFGLSNSLKP